MNNNQNKCEIKCDDQLKREAVGFVGASDLNRFICVCSDSDSLRCAFL